MTDSEGDRYEGDEKSVQQNSALSEPDIESKSDGSSIDAKQTVGDLSPKGTVTIDAGIEETRENRDIVKQLDSLLEKNPDGHREIVSIFASRKALRLFGFAVSWSLSEEADFDSKAEACDWLGLVWINLIAAWANDRDSIERWFVDLEFALDIAMDDAFSAVDAVKVAALPILEPSDDELDKLIFWAANSAVYDEKDEFSERFDLDRLEIDSASTLRVCPLWNTEFSNWKGHSHWLDAIDKWIFENENRVSPANIEFLQQLKRNYTAIIDGSWGDKVEGIPQVTYGADEKTRTDAPAVVDYLGRDELVEALIPRLSTDKENDHLTIGLLGDWGIGKSSVIRQLQEKLIETKSDIEFLFGTFNAWSYEHTGNMQAGIAHEVTLALAKPWKAEEERLKHSGAKQKNSSSEFSDYGFFRRLWYQFRVASKLAISLHGIRMLSILLSLAVLAGFAFITGSQVFDDNGQLALAGVGAAGFIGFLVVLYQQFRNYASLPLAQEFKTYLRVPDYKAHLGTIPEMQTNIRALCENCLGTKLSEKNRRLVFFIDDLDRCDVDGIVKTFEAVRLVLDIPNVIVVIAMDQRIALPALACHYEKLSKFHQRDPLSIARDYLGKVIHLPVRLSLPNEASVARYLARLFDDDDFINRVPKEESVKPESETKVTEKDQSEPGEDSESKTEAADEKEIPSLEEMLEDINRIDVRAILSAAHDQTEPGEVTFEQGFGEAQKQAFYRGLLDFNLRNPRQIKRLYNSYNLLWSMQAQRWAGEDWLPNLQGLLVLEMINEFVPAGIHHDGRDHYRRTFFSKIGAFDSLDHPEVDLEALANVRTRILAYQEETGVELRALLGPFVLPAVKAVSNRDDKEAGDLT